LGSYVVAGWLRRKVLALGTLQEIKTAFGDKIDGKITTVPINSDELTLENGVIIGLLRQAIVRALGNTRGLETDGKHIIWKKDPIPDKTHHINERTFNIHQAARLSLRWYSGELFLVLEPTVEVIDTTGEKVSREIDRRLRNVELSKQHNQEFSDQVNHWLNELLPNRQSSFTFPPSQESIF
jgi:hypothetical protein